MNFIPPTSSFGFARVRGCMVLLGAGVMLMSSGLGAADGSSSVRTALSERLRSEFQYQPQTGQESGREAGDEQAIRMQPFIVTGRKDKSDELARIFRTQRELELEQKPSLKRGASIERNIGGRPATIGPRPYRDLLKDDARFKTSKAITPTWNLLDFKM